MKTIINITATPSEMESLFYKHINHNADIRFYQFVAPSRCMVLVEHNEGVILKEGATYSLKGFLARCETKLDKLNVNFPTWKASCLMFVVGKTKRLKEEDGVME